jgi:hypothetical protein
VDAVEAVYVLQNAASESEIRDAEDSFIACGQELTGRTDITMIGDMLQTLRSAAAAERVEADVAFECVDRLGGVSATPLPGLSEALATLEL